MSEKVKRGSRVTFRSLGIFVKGEWARHPIECGMWLNWGFVSIGEASPYSRPPTLADESAKDLEFILAALDGDDCDVE